MTGDEASATAALFRALGDPARVRLVNLLATADEPVCVCELTPHLGLTQPTVSHHLRKLLDVGLLRREQRGTWAFYSLDRAALDRLQAVATFAPARSEIGEEVTRMALEPRCCDESCDCGDDCC